MTSDPLPGDATGLRHAISMLHAAVYGDGDVPRWFDERLNDVILAATPALPSQTVDQGLRTALERLYQAELDRLREEDEGWNMLDPRHNARVDRWHVAMDQAAAALEGPDHD